MGPNAETLVVLPTLEEACPTVHKPHSGFVTPTVLAGVPGAIPEAERPAHFALITRLAREATRERKDIPNGYAFRYDPEAFDDVARWVTNERRCCTFLTFTIEVSAHNGPLWVRLPARRVPVNFSTPR